MSRPDGNGDEHSVKQQILDNSPCCSKTMYLYCREEDKNGYTRFTLVILEPRVEQCRDKVQKRQRTFRTAALRVPVTRDPPSYFMKRKNPFRKYSRPKHPAPIPRNQKYFILIKAAMDESRIAIWRNMAANPNVPECV